jgi:hypothetical protein
MPSPIPDNVKDILGQLTGAQQVVLRAYIATLREEIKSFEEQAKAAADPEPHAHYHGHDKCTADHGHESHDHKESHDHDHKASSGHDHDHKKYVTCSFLAFYNVI